MKTIFTLMTLFAFKVLVYAQTSDITFDTVENGLKPCWQSMYSKDTLKGVILDYLPNNVACGKLLTASTAFIKLSNGDTIRLIQFCDEKKIKYHRLQKVNITTAPFTSVATTYMPISRGDSECKIWKTYFGYILRKKKSTKR